MPETVDELPEKLGAAHSKQALRLWLRLLTCSTEIRKIISNRLAREFECTLPRFDILSALDRNREGVTMGELSQLLMVSNGNVTGLVNRLVKEGLIERDADEHDRRIFRVTMTERGASVFETMAQRHEQWLDDMLAGLDTEEIDSLLASLNNLRVSVSRRKLNRS